MSVMTAVDPEHSDLVPLGDGPVAHVLAGVDASGHGFALKVFPRKLDRRTRAEVVQELGRLSSLRGQAPVLVPDALEDATKGRCALRMELCAQSLPELLAAFGPLSVADTLALGHSLAAALTAAHQARHVHGGVTPGNVLFRPSGEAVLSDFGLTMRRAFPPDPINGVDDLSPETIRDGTIDERSDLYGLGVVLYLSLTGRSPHQGPTGEDPGQRMLRMLGSPTPPINVPGVPDELRNLIASLTQKNPRDRPFRAEEVLHRLSTMLGPAVAELPGHPAPPPPAPSILEAPAPSPSAAHVPAAQPAALDPDSTIPLPAAVGDVRPTAFDDFAAPTPATTHHAAPSFDQTSATTYTPDADRADRLVVEFGPSKRRRTVPRTALALAAAGGFLLATTAAVLLLLRGPVELSVAQDERDSGRGHSGTPPVAGPSTAHIELDEPVDQGDVIQLSWRSDQDLDYAVVISPAGGENDVVLTNDATTHQVRVDPTRQYCFAVQGTDGTQVVESAPRPVRDADCNR